MRFTTAFVLFSFGSGCVPGQDINPLPNYPDCTWQLQRTLAHDEVWAGLVTPDEVIATLDGQTRTWGMSPDTPETASESIPIADLTMALEYDGDPGEYELLDSSGAPNCQNGGTPTLIVTTTAVFSSADQAWSFVGSLPLFYYPSTDPEMSTVFVERMAVPGPIPSLTATAIGSSTDLGPRVDEACSADLHEEFFGGDRWLYGDLYAVCADGSHDRVASTEWDVL